MNNQNDNIKKALLVIDIQEDATGKTAKQPYKNSQALISNVNLVIYFPIIGIRKTSYL